MSGTLGLIREAIGEPTSEIIVLSDILDSKVKMQEFWKSDIGIALSSILQKDSVRCLNELLEFESLTQDQIRGYLSKYRANTMTLASIKETSNIDEVQQLLDNAVKSRAEQLRR